VATEAARLNGKKRENSWKEQNTIDVDRPSHGRSWPVCDQPCSAFLRSY
jgi:hypothetical protein